MNHCSSVAEANLLARMNEVISDPDHPLMSCAIGIVKDGEIRFADAVGMKNPAGAPATADTKFRIASISKLNTAIGVWRLIERGLVDPEADVSQYLGFRLRNPNYPDTPITVRMLMSHTSSVRDGAPGVYNIPYPHRISEYFTEGQPCYNPKCWATAGQAPGEFFAYCNMNYCLLGTVIENVSGQRFDRYMIEHVYAPLGLSCSFNVAGMPREVQERVGTLYFKVNEKDEFDAANGTWTAQMDDFSQGYPDQNYDEYEIGTNGSLFGPMGSLRISIRELCRIMQMLCSGGCLDGVQILKPETIEKMFTPVWNYDPDGNNGETCGEQMYCYGMGPHIFTNRYQDRLVEGQKLPFTGHTAEAYGLMGCIAFDRKKGNGIVYYISGLGCDPAQYRGSYSSFCSWEERLLTAAAEFAQFDY